MIISTFWKADPKTSHALRVNPRNMNLLYRKTILCAFMCVYTYIETVIFVWFLGDSLDSRTMKLYHLFEILQWVLRRLWIETMELFWTTFSLKLSEYFDLFYTSHSKHHLISFLEKENGTSALELPSNPLFFLTLKMTIKLKVLSSQSERSTWYSFRTVDRKQQLLSMLGLSILQALAHKKQMRRTLSSLCSMLLTELGQYFK